MDSGSYLVLKVGTEHTNSSWHTGTHSASITYTLGASDGSSGGSSGGGGGGSTSEVGFWLNWLFSGLRGLVVFTVLGVLALAGGLWVGARLK